MSAVRRARKEAGLPVANYNEDYDHPLVGKRIKYIPTNTEYTIKSAKKQWYWGWYIGFLIEQDNGSGTFVYWEQDQNNPTCYDGIIAEIKDNEDAFEVLL
jgi:hypothetical protein